MTQNTLYINDNLYVMSGMNSESVDLIYIDPPFNSKKFYSAPIGSKAAGASFDDMWTWQDVDAAYLEKLYDDYPRLSHFIYSIQGIHGKGMASYSAFMAQRLMEIYRILKPTGSFYLHCDPTASHYLKIVCDRIFGKSNFVNEIVWHYRRWTGKAKKFQKLHDIILFYVKSKDYNFNVMYADYTEKSMKRKQNYHTRIKGDDVFVTSINEKGVRENDVWQIPILNSQSNERTGYPTQKPLELLHRIIKASSMENDVVFDPFCGCATTMVAAQQLNRKWIGVDIEHKAAELVMERLKDDTGLFTDFTHTDLVPQRTDVKVELPTAKNKIKGKLYKEQDKKCNGCEQETRIGLMDVDHVIPKSRGGGDYYGNYQLLCRECNVKKGDKPMEYLKAKIAARMNAMQKISFTGEA